MVFASDSTPEAIQNDHIAETNFDEQSEPSIWQKCEKRVIKQSIFEYKNQKIVSAYKA